MSKPFCCPNCLRPWDETEAARLRMWRIVDGQVSLDDDLLRPGFVADLRLVLAALNSQEAGDGPK